MEHVLGPQKGNSGVPEPCPGAKLISTLQMVSSLSEWGNVHICDCVVCVCLSVRVPARTQMDTEGPSRDVKRGRKESGRELC